MSAPQAIDVLRRNTLRNYAELSPLCQEMAECLDLERRRQLYQQIKGLERYADDTTKLVRNLRRQAGDRTLP